MAIAIFLQLKRALLDDPVQKWARCLMRAWRLKAGILLVVAAFASSCGRHAERCTTHKVSNGELTECR